ncbi:MAG: AIPR family protein [Treponema sp.]|nr:AIPR family protein [Treponema sp.]
MPTPSTITPTIVTIKYEKYTEINIFDCTEYTFYVNGQEYKELPLDANVREPNVNKSKPYKAMLDTLSDKPQDFFENNLGISVIASNVKVYTSTNKAELTFQSGTGILNGGHSQRAVLDSQSDPDISKAIIKIVVRKKNYSLERIADIAACQNSSTAVKEYSLAEKKGLFTVIKKSIDPNKEKHIYWWEGREVPNNKGMDPQDLIALINVFNIELYRSRYNTAGKAQPTGSANGKSSVFHKWENNTGSFEKIYPLINDMIELSEYIKIHFADKTGISKLNVIQESKNKRNIPLIFSGQIPAFELPSQFLYPIISAFRANVYYDEASKKIGWFNNNFSLFDDHKKNLCDKLISFYTQSYGNNINKAGKDPNLYEALYNELNYYITTSGTPEKIYDI